MKLLIKIFLAALLFVPSYALAATAVPWSITNLSDSFIFPNRVNGNIKGIFVSASSTIGNGIANGGLTVSGGATTTATSSLNGLLIPTGIVGIGTSSPLRSLHIENTSGSSIVLGRNDTAIGAADVIGSILFDSNDLTSAASGYRSKILSVAEDGGGAAALTFSNAISSSGGGYNTDATIERMRITSTGRVGVGSSTPTQFLVVEGASGTNSATPITTVIKSTSNSDGWTADASFGRISFDSSDVTAPGTRARFDARMENTLGSLTALSFSTFSTVLTERMRVASNGNVGIGTTSPFGMLSLHHPATGGNIPLLVIASSTPTGTSTLFSISNTGEMAFGTTTYAAPTVSTCGSVPNGSLVTGNDSVGTVLIGGGVVTACTVTYSTPKRGTPHVFIQVEGAAAIANSVSASSATGFTVTFAATLGSGSFDYFIISN